MASVKYKPTLPFDIASNKSGGQDNSGGSRGFFGLEKSEEDDEAKMMGVLIEEIKEVMCASLLELLNSKKLLDQE